MVRRALLRVLILINFFCFDITYTKTLHSSKRLSIFLFFTVISFPATVSGAVVTSQPNHHNYCIAPVALNPGLQYAKLLRKNELWDKLITSKICSMSFEERTELAALFSWLKTFPQIEQFYGDKENAELDDMQLLNDPKFVR